MDNLTGLLSWITGSNGGAFIIVAWFVAWLLEDFAWWHNLDAKVKTVIVIAVSGVIGAVAVYAQSNPAFVAAVDPYVRPFMFAIAAWISTQTAHKADKALAK